MNIRSLSCLPLLACSGVHSSADAPFEMPAIHASLWSIGKEEDEALQAAMLVLTSSKGLGCPQLDGVSELAAMERVIENGTGLVFNLYSFKEGADWAGAWTEDGSYFLTDEETDSHEGRYLYFGAFDQGMYYELGYDAENSWLNLDKVDDKRVTGEFRSDWWWGEFRAEPCPGWDAELPTTTTPYGY